MAARRFKLIPEMEGRTARWYARQRGTESQLVEYRKQAAQLAEGLANGSHVLEIAPGPGFLAIEMARSRLFQVTGVDISRTFVELATERARLEGVEVTFKQGDAGHLPFEASTFDRIVCQAAFKNFPNPLRAINEMHRVLRVGGTAVIQDLSRDATADDIRAEVQRMKVSPLNALTTRFILGTMLRRRAYRPAQLQALAAESLFGRCEMRTEGIGLEVRLTKRAAQAAA